MIRIIFHEGIASGQTSRHHFGGTYKGGRFPIAFAGIAEPCLHEPLCGDAGQLFHAVEVFEGIGESLEATVYEEAAEADFDLGSIADVPVLFSAGVDRGAERISCVVFFVSGIYLLM